MTSSSRNAPAYGWGLGKEPSKGSDRGDASPSGCDKFYELGEMVGPQPVSTRRSPAAYAFSTSARFAGEQAGLRRVAAAPGPGAYNIRPEPGRGGVVKTVDGTSKTQPAFRFGSERRFAAAPKAQGAAPTAYSARPAVGAQVSSERRSGSAYGFGSSRRFDESVTRAVSKATPGPGAYNA